MRIIPCLILLAVLGVPLDASRSAPASPPPTLAEHHWRACGHYDNRARFRPRGQGDFIVQMAEACARAIADVEAPETTFAARRLAIAYLDRLAAFREQVKAINTTRVYGPDAGPRSLPIGYGARPVTQTGEYLVARSMGVLSALEAWRRDADREVAERR